MDFIWTIPATARGFVVLRREVGSKKAWQLTANMIVSHFDDVVDNAAEAAVANANANLFWTERDRVARREREVECDVVIVTITSGPEYGRFWQERLVGNRWQLGYNVWHVPATGQRLIRIEDGLPWDAIRAA